MINIRDLTDLYYAVLDHSPNRVEKLLAAGADPRECHPRLGSIVDCATQFGDFEIVKLLLEREAFLEKKAVSINPKFLHTAICFGHLRLVKYFLEQGAEELGYLPIYNAVNHGRFALAGCEQKESLKVAYASVGQAYFFLKSASQRFLGFKIFYHDLLNLLIHNISVGNDIYQSWWSLSLEIKMLMLRGLTREEMVLGLLNVAVKRNNVTLVQELIKMGIDVNVFNSARKQAIHYATHSEHRVIKELLITERERVDKLVLKLVDLPKDQIPEFLENNKISINHVDRDGYSALYTAVEKSHPDAVEKLLEMGADFAQPNSSQKLFALDCAVRRGNLDILKLLLKKVVPMKDNMAVIYQNLLLSSARYGHLAIFKYLQEQGANIRQVDEHGRLPIHYAASKGHSAILQYLLEQGENINSPDATVESFLPVHYAARHGRVEVLKFLLSNGSEVDPMLRISKRTPLAFALELGDESVVNVLLAANANIELALAGFERQVLAISRDYALPAGAYASTGEAYLALKAESKKRPGFKIFYRDLLSLLIQNLKFGNDIGSIWEILSKEIKKLSFTKEETALGLLTVAVKRNNATLVQTLIEMGVDVNAFNSEGKQAIHYAVGPKSQTIKELLTIESERTDPLVTALSYLARDQIPNYLAKNKISINHTRKDGLSALYLDVCWNRSVEALLEMGANPNQRQGAGRSSALDVAAQQGYLDTVKVLLKQGALIDGVPGTTRPNPLHYAARRGHITIVQHLLEEGSNINHPDEFNYYPIHLAANYGHLEIVKLLTDKGSIIDPLLNITKQTPLAFALSKGHKEIVKYLLIKNADLEKALSSCREKYFSGNTCFLNAFENYVRLKSEVELQRLAGSEAFYPMLFELIKDNLGNSKRFNWRKLLKNLIENRYQKLDLTAGLLSIVAGRASINTVNGDLAPDSKWIRTVCEEIQVIRNNMGNNDTDKAVLLKMHKEGFDVRFEAMPEKSHESLSIKVERLVAPGAPFKITILQYLPEFGRQIKLTREVDFSLEDSINFKITKYANASFSLDKQGHLSIKGLKANAHLTVDTIASCELKSINLGHSQLDIKKASSVLFGDKIQTRGRVSCVSDKVINQGCLTVGAVNFKRTPGLRSAVTLDNRNGKIEVIKHFAIYGGTLCNDKGSIKADTVHVQSMGELHNREGIICSARGGSLNIRSDIHNRGGCLTSLEGNLKVETNGKISTTNQGIICAEKGQLKIAAHRVLTDESSLLHGKTKTLLDVAGLSQDSIMSGERLSLISETNLVLPKPFVFEKKLSIKAPNIDNHARWHANNMECRTRNLTLSNRITANQGMNLTVDQIFGDMDKYVSAKRALRLSYREGFDWVTPFKNSGSIDISIAKDAQRPFNVLTDITVGYTGHIKGNINIKAPKTNIGREEGPYVTVSASGRVKVDATACDLIHGRMIGHEGISIKAKDPVVLGRLSKKDPSKMPSGLLTNGKLQVESGEKVTIQEACLYGKMGVLFTAGVEVDNIAGHITTDGNGKVDAPLFRHRLLHEVIPGPAGETKKALTEGAFMRVGGELETTGATEIFGSQIYRESFKGQEPNLHTFIPMECYQTQKQVVVGQKSHWFHGKSDVYGWVTVNNAVVGQPIQAICSSGKELVLKKEMFDFNAILSAPLIRFAQVTNGQFGVRLSFKFSLPKPTPFLQEVSLATLSKHLSPLLCISKNPCAETIMECVLPRGLALLLPPVTVLAPDGSLHDNTGKLKKLFPPEQEAELLVRNLMRQLGRGFLDTETTEPMAMLHRVMANAIQLRETGEAKPGLDHDGKIKWLSSLAIPIMVYREAEYEGKRILTPAIIFPNSWDKPGVRTGAGIAYSFGDMIFTGTGRDRAELTITAHLDAKGTIRFEHFNKLIEETRVAEKAVQVFDRFESKTWYGATKVSITPKTTIVREAQAGNDITAAGVVYNDIEELKAKGLQMNLGDDGVTSRNVGMIDAQAVQETRLEFAESGRKKAFCGSKSSTYRAKHSFIPTEIRSTGLVDLQADAMSLQAVDIGVTGNASVHLETLKRTMAFPGVKATDDLAPVHGTKGLQTVITTGTQEVGLCAKITTENGEIKLKSEDKITGDAPSLQTKDVLISAKNDVYFNVFKLKTQQNTRIRGVNGFAYKRADIQVKHESGQVPTMVAGKNIEIESKNGNVIVVAPIFIAGQKLSLEALEGLVDIQTATFHHDITRQDISAGLKFMGSAAMEAAMAKDFRMAGHSLLREFPLLAGMKDLMDSEDTADTVANGMKTLYNIYNTYKAFSNAESVGAFLGGQINLNPKLRLGEGSSEEHFTTVALPWLQAKEICIKAKNIHGTGIQADCENLTLEAAEKMLLEAAEQTTRSRSEDIGVSIGLSAVPSLGADMAKSESKAVHYLQSHFNVANMTTLTAGDQISLKGVCISTLKAVVDAETLHLETLQATQTSSSESGHISTDLMMGCSSSDSAKRWTQEQTAIVAQETLIANIRQKIELVGAKVVVNPHGTVVPTLRAEDPDGSVVEFYEHVMGTEDNNCGFFSLAVSRDKAARQLLDNTLDAAKIQALRDLVAPEIRAAILTGQLPRLMNVRTELVNNIFEAQTEVDRTLNRMKTKYPNLPKVVAEEFLAFIPELMDKHELNSSLEARNRADEALLAYCAEQSTYESFIRHYVAVPGNQLAYLRAENGKNPTSSMDAIAKLNHLNIRVWVKERPDVDNCPLTLVHTYISGPNSRWVNLHHTRKVQGYDTGILCHFNVLSTHPGLAIAPQIYHKDVIDCEKSEHTGIDLNLSGLGSQSAIKGTFDGDYSKVHKERVNRATLSGNIEVQGGGNASGINRDNNAAQEQTKDQKHHYRAFTLLGDPVAIIEEIGSTLKSKPVVVPKKQNNSQAKSSETPDDIDAETDASKSMKGKDGDRDKEKDLFDIKKAMSEDNIPESVQKVVLADPDILAMLRHAPELEKTMNEQLAKVPLENMELGRAGQKSSTQKQAPVKVLDIVLDYANRLTFATLKAASNLVVGDAVASELPQHKSLEPSSQKPDQKLSLMDKTKIIQDNSDVKPAASWLNLAWRSFQGERSQEVLSWQQKNRDQAPSLASMSDGLQSSKPIKVAEKFVRSANERIKNTGVFIGEEAARFHLGEQTKTEAAIKTAGTFVKATGTFMGEEVARVSLNEHTKTEQFIKTVGAFAKEEAVRFRRGEETKTGRAIANGFDQLSKMSADEVAHHLGTGVVDVGLGYGLARGLSIVSQGSDAVVSGIKRELLRNPQPKPPLFYQYGFITRHGVTLEQLKKQNHLLRKTIEDAQRGTGTARAGSATDAIRLKAELSFKEAGFLDANGKLTEKALENKKFIKGGKDFKNNAVIEVLTKNGENITDWTKYSTDSIKLSNGQSKQIHYYFNKNTGKVDYSHIDFKVKDPINPFEIIRKIENSNHLKP